MCYPKPPPEVRKEKGEGLLHLNITQSFVPDLLMSRTATLTEGPTKSSHLTDFCFPANPSDKEAESEHGTHQPWKLASDSRNPPLPSLGNVLLALIPIKVGEGAVIVSRLQRWSNPIWGHSAP